MDLLKHVFKNSWTLPRNTYSAQFQLKEGVLTGGLTIKFKQPFKNQSPLETQVIPPVYCKTNYRSDAAIQFPHILHKPKPQKNKRKKYIKIYRIPNI